MTKTPAALNTTTDDFIDKKIRSSGFVEKVLRLYELNSHIMHINLSKGLCDVGLLLSFVFVVNNKMQQQQQQQQNREKIAYKSM